MQYTPQQQMGFAGYSVPCRVGNWAEDEYLGALVAEEHKKSLAEGTLTASRLAATIGSASAPIELAAPHADGFVHYGDEIMLSNAQGGALACNWQDRVEVSQESYAITRGAAEPAERTCWRVLPAHGAAAPADGILRFGAHFTLGSERGGELLYLQSQRYTVHNMNYSRSVRGSERKQGVTGALVTNWQTNWEAVHLDPTKLAQIRSEGQPVLANAFVALRHTSTQLNLCSDSLVVKNHFGHEAEVCCFMDTDIAKSTMGERTSHAVGASNHWAFTTGVPAAMPPVPETGSVIVSEANAPVMS